VAVTDVPAIAHTHFISALNQVRASVNSAELHLYEEWNAQFGSFGEALDADKDE
jgi:Vps4 C terminal oligomerisation domain